MSLIRADDYLYEHPKHVPNIYWSELIKTIDEFDQLLQIGTFDFNKEKKEISGFLKQKIHKKIDLIKRFYEYKESIKFVGQVIKKQLIFLDKEKFELFFHGYFKQIKYITHHILHNPQKFADQLVNYKCYKKYNFLDFCQNIPVLIYPYYMPIGVRKTNYCLQFIEEIVNLWPYSIEYARPKHHSLIDDVIYGFLKVPPILCYVQKISSRFLKEVGNCRMEIFAFDEDAIKNEIDIKKHATISYTQPEKKSFASKIKGFFRKGKDDNSISEQIMIKQSMTAMGPQRSQSQYSTVPEMMKRRQTSFIELLKNTVQNILNEEPPMLLKKMMQFFRKKVQRQLMKQGKPIQVETKHYCYFLLTNFICAQLHNKFTIAHEDMGMTNADLQNISEIIRIICSIFQGQDPELKYFFCLNRRYKNVIYNLNDYKQQVKDFYDNFFVDDFEEDFQEQNMKETLINYYENNILLSFNDVKIVVDVYHEMKCRETKKVDERLKFLQKPEINALFDPSKKVKFDNLLYSPQNVIFVQDWSDKSKKEILQYIVANEQPLQYLPMLRDVFFFSSNLNVQQSLEVAQDLKLIKRMPLKSIKQYLVRTANKFTHLNIKDFFTIERAFKDSLKSCLQNNLKRKQCILYYRSEILYQLQEQNDFINFFINQLKSQQFYEKISESFLLTVKIRAYVNIENNLLKVNKDMKELKGLGISNLMLANNDKGSQKSNEDYILRNSFKQFELINQLLRCLAKNAITKSALIAGRKVQEFNLTFTKAIEIAVFYISDFLKKKSLLQNISKQKLQILVIKKMQNMIFIRYIEKEIEDDKKLYKMSLLTDKKLFYKHEIEKHQIDTDFLIIEANQKLRKMIEQVNVTNKIVHLKELFTLIMTIIGFTIRSSKVSSDIMTPLLQYIILQCANLGHFKCLYAIECLKYNKDPEIEFMITTYRSSLIYIKENMALDYTKPGCEDQVQQHFSTGIQKNKAH